MASIRSLNSNMEWNAPTILFMTLGSTCLLASGLLLSNNEASFVKGDTERQLLNDTAVLIRGLGTELAMLATVAWCSVLNGHSRALARWWAVGLIPNIWNKFISGDEAGAKSNLAIALVALYLGWAGKAAAPAKRFDGPTIYFVVIGSICALVSGLLLSNNE